MATDRRKFIKQSALLALSGLAAKSAIGNMVTNVQPVAQAQQAPAPMGYLLPPLPYAYDALVPHIDKLTMEIHHDKHHKAYVDNLNKAFAALNPKPAETPSLEMLMATISKYPVAIKNNGGGHYNHSLFWKLLSPPPSNALNTAGKLAQAINTTFGNFDTFKSQFTDAATKRFGSGWAWLIVDKSGSTPALKIISTANQDNPLMDTAEIKGQPILALDVWEHAYYLNYQNRRAEYIASWFNLVNWTYAEELFAKA